MSKVYYIHTNVISRISKASHAFVLGFSNFPRATQSPFSNTVMGLQGFHATEALGEIQKRWEGMLESSSCFLGVVA